MDLAKSRDFLDPSEVRERIHIIGCGAVGSTLAENLARFGFTKISLYDFDKVEPHNIANQMFTQSDIGRTKVEAVRDMILMINPDAINDINCIYDGWHGQRLSGYVFLCVDNIETRKQIVEQNKYNCNLKAMFDIRMRLVDAQHYAADWRKKDMVDNMIASMNFTHEEAIADTPMSACNVALSVCPTVRIIVANAVANLVNFIKTGNLKKTIFINAFSFETEAY